MEFRSSLALLPRLSPSSYTLTWIIDCTSHEDNRGAFLCFWRTVQDLFSTFFQEQGERAGKHFSIPFLGVTGRREDMGLMACNYCFYLRFLVLSTHFLLQLMTISSEPCTKLVPVGTDAPSSPGSSGGIRKEKPSQMYQNWWNHNQDLAQFYSIYSQEDRP